MYGRQYISYVTVPYGKRSAHTGAPGRPHRRARPRDPKLGRSPARPRRGRRRRSGLARGRRPAHRGFAPRGRDAPAPFNRLARPPRRVLGRPRRSGSGRHAREVVPPRREAVPSAGPRLCAEGCRLAALRPTQSPDVRPVYDSVRGGASRDDASCASRLRSARAARVRARLRRRRVQTPSPRARAFSHKCFDVGRELRRGRGAAAPPAGPEQGRTPSAAPRRRLSTP